MNLLPRYFGRATGQHRKPAVPAPGALVGQDFRPCEPCGVDTVHNVRRDGTAACTEDHRATDGDPT